MTMTGRTSCLRAPVLVSSEDQTTEKKSSRSISQFCSDLQYQPKFSEEENVCQRRAEEKLAVQHTCDREPGQPTFREFGRCGPHRKTFNVLSVPNDPSQRSIRKHKACEERVFKIPSAQGPDRYVTLEKFSNDQGLKREHWFFLDAGLFSTDLRRFLAPWIVRDSQGGGNLIAESAAVSLGWLKSRDRDSYRRRHNKLLAKLHSMARFVASRPSLRLSGQDELESNGYSLLARGFLPIEGTCDFLMHIEASGKWLWVEAAVVKDEYLPPNAWKVLLGQRLRREADLLIDPIDVFPMRVLPEGCTALTTPSQSQRISQNTDQ